MAVEKRGDRWRVRIRKDAYPTVSKTFNRHDDAKAFERETLTAMENGSFFSGKKVTVSRLIDNFLEDPLHGLAILAESEQRTRKSQLEWWRARIGRHEANQWRMLRALVAQELKSLAGRGRSPATVNRYRSALSRVFTVVVRDDGILDINPIREVGRAREAKKQPRYLADGERIALMEECRESSSRTLYLFCLMGLRTGARQGSLRKLQWQDVDLKARTILFRQTKAGIDVLVHVPPDLHELLDEWRKVRSIDGLVFPGGNFPVKAWRLARSRAAKKAPTLLVPKQFDFRNFRDTSATLMAIKGASIAELMAQHGWTTVVMPARYTELAQLLRHSKMIDEIASDQGVS